MTAVVATGVTATRVVAVTATALTIFTNLSLACVRCGGDHPALSCPRPREEPATCANCGGEHPANNIHCPVFERELRNKKAGTVAITGEPRQRPAPVNPQPTGERAQGASLMAEANAPTPRGTTTTSATGRKRKRGGRRGKPQAPIDNEKRERDLATDPRPPTNRPTAAAPAADTTAAEVKSRPARTQGATSGTKGSATATIKNTKKNEDTKAVIQAEIRILQEVMTAISEERDTATILQITLKGVADLITRHG